MPDAKTKPTATTGDIADTAARRMLADLQRADAAVRSYPEPRRGPEFERTQRSWSATYARAIGLGAQFAAEEP